MNLHQLCEAYRRGDRWYIDDGCQDATGKTARQAANKLVKPPANLEDIEGGYCVPLSREIAYRLTFNEPFTPTETIVTSMLNGCTVGDLLLIAKCLREAMKEKEG